MYQAIYDAVRSKLSGCDVSEAVESAVKSANFGHITHLMEISIREVQDERTRPSAIFRPNLFPEGCMWCALYGKNLQEGLAAFGKTPSGALINFDRVFHGYLPLDQ